MKGFWGKLNNKGFSIIELMVVVGIIGVLAALAAPRFKSFSAKARQSEAKVTLSQIYTLEEAYQLDNNTYTSLSAIGRTSGQCGTTGTNGNGSNGLGFFLSDCSNSNYEYSISGSAGAFTATATSGSGSSNKVRPGCTTADVWTINQDKSLQNTTNTLTSTASGCN